MHWQRKYTLLSPSGSHIFRMCMGKFRYHCLHTHMDSSWCIQATLHIHSFRRDFRVLPVNGNDCLSMKLCIDRGIQFRFVVPCIHHVILQMDFFAIIVHHLLDKAFSYIHICDVWKGWIVFRNPRFGNRMPISSQLACINGNTGNI